MLQRRGINVEVSRRHRIRISCAPIERVVGVLDRFAVPLEVYSPTGTGRILNGQKPADLPVVAVILRSRVLAAALR